MASTRIAAEVKYAGAQVAVLENENIRVKVVPEKGSDIVEIVYKKRNLNLLYESPIGFRRFGTLSAPSVTGPPNETVSQSLIELILQFKIANAPGSANDVAAPACNQQGPFTFNGKTSQFPQVTYGGKG